MVALTLVSTSEEATLGLGAAIAAQLRPGMVVALHGDLGTGKTVLSRGIARGLGITEPVTSPTFTVVQEYFRPDGTLFFHLDLYRIDDEAAALAFGIEEYLFAPDGVAVVEWPERIGGLLMSPGGARRVVSVHLAHRGDDSRRIRLPHEFAACVRALASAGPDLGLREITEEPP